jgi:hypothetical protein
MAPLPAPISMCVIRIDNGPGHRRYAAISITADLLRSGDVRRFQRHALDEILGEVRDFLIEAGIRNATQDGTTLLEQ